MLVSSALTGPLTLPFTDNCLLGLDIKQMPEGGICGEGERNEKRHRTIFRFHALYRGTHNKTGKTNILIRIKI